MGADMDVTWWQVVVQVVGPVALVGLFVLYRSIHIHAHKISVLEDDLRNERRMRNTVIETDIHEIKERLIRIETLLEKDK